MNKLNTTRLSVVMFLAATIGASTSACSSNDSSSGSPAGDGNLGAGSGNGGGVNGGGTLNGGGTNGGVNGGVNNSGGENGSNPGAGPGGGDSGTASTGGGDAGSDSRGPSAPLPSQCTDLATAACNQIAKCDTIDMAEEFDGDMATCVAQMLSLCPSISAAGTSNTPASIEACANAIGELSTCSAFIDYLYQVGDNSLPSGDEIDQLCPTTAGTLANGATCGDDSQCVGGYCPTAAGAACGACAPAPATTSCAESSNCPNGQVCNTSNACVAPGGVGATCDDSDPSSAALPCAASLYCKFASANATSGKCAALGTAGQACSAADDVNDCVDGLFCNAQGACATVQFVAVGGACDDAGLVCKGWTCFYATATATTGVCTARAAEGAACQADAQGDDNCPFDADCVSGTCSAASPVCN